MGVWGTGFVFFRLGAYDLDVLREQGRLDELVSETLEGYVIPFVPGSGIALIMLGFVVAYGQLHLGLIALLYAFGGVAAYSVTTAIMFVRATAQGNAGYAAEQSSAILLLLVGPALGLTAAPLWAVAGFIVGWVARRTMTRT